MNGGHVFVLSAGGGMGPWIWERLVPLLDHPALVLDERSPRDRPDPTIVDCAEYAAQRIRSSGAVEAILVAHSGAGVMASAVAHRCPVVRRIVFVSAGIPAEGTNLLRGLPLPVRLLNIVAMRMNRRPVAARSREKIIRRAFANASPEDVIQHILGQSIRPEPLSLAFERVFRADLRPVPALYIKLLRDHTISVRGQERMMANYGSPESVSIDADHMVMLSKPEALADALNGEARKLGWAMAPVGR